VQVNKLFGGVVSARKRAVSVDNPVQIGLPFFAYGIFQPGQLGYHRLRELVQEARRACRIRGSLRIRDGLPLIDPDGSGEVAGTILVFKPEGTAEAYKRIGDIEPDKHYRWDQRDAQGIQVNVLVGRSPKKGSVEADQEWDGRSDPLFTSALEVIEESLISNSHFEWDLKPLFRLQMAYLLLWYLFSGVGAEPDGVGVGSRRPAASR
jgi:hypothetical protein